MELDASNAAAEQLVADILQTLGSYTEAEQHMKSSTAKAKRANSDTSRESVCDRFLKMSNTEQFVVKSTSPNILVMENFLSTDTSLAIMELAKTKMKDSMVSGGRKYHAENWRNSSTAWLKLQAYEETKSMVKKLSTILDLDPELLYSSSEDLQVVKYDGNGYFKPHHDAYGSLVLCHFSFVTIMFKLHPFSRLGRALYLFI
eukprot:m.64263 g.64263  ORF g.64263 m.64263 type:complete len:202 (+) comp11635_c0_seq5:600-1205(+)